jgi:dolichyl-phosphate-mannose--protein O-mannosyl transferase
LRFSRLSVPHAVIFDETYYVPDAWGILRFGVEHNYIASRNALIARGDGRIFAPGGEFVVHPPFGKILIAGGEWVFGLTPFGWRFAAAAAGSVAILMVARVARRMTRSTLLCGWAGGRWTASLAMSRTAPLTSVMFWVLAAPEAPGDLTATAPGPGWRGGGGDERRAAAGALAGWPPGVPGPGVRRAERRLVCAVRFRG